jgi:hypothetical protein
LVVVGTAVELGTTVGVVVQVSGHTVPCSTQVVVSTVTSGVVSCFDSPLHDANIAMMAIIAILFMGAKKMQKANNVNTSLALT